MNQFVSVIVPTFNRPESTSRAVESALRQSHSDLEVIVVDDGSTDDTVDALVASHGSDVRLKIVNRSNGGPAAARNTGLEIASGDFVAFLDSDDRWLPWKLEFQLGCLNLLPEVGLIWTDMLAVDSGGNQVEPRYLRTMYRRYADAPLDEVFRASTKLGPDIDGAPTGTTIWHGDIYGHMLAGSLIHTSTVVLDRSRLDAVGGFDESLLVAGEDFDFHLRACAAGPVALADVSTIEYQIGGSDQLNRPENQVHVARNFLRTVEKAVDSAHHDDNRVTARNSSYALGKANQWVAEELLSRGDRRTARSHLWRGIRSDSTLRGSALWLLSWFPLPVMRLVRRIYRAFNRRRHQAARVGMATQDDQQH